MIERLRVVIERDRGLALAALCLLAIAGAPATGALAEGSGGAGILEATGSGTVDMAKAKSKVQARMLALRAARVDAQRNLLEAIEGVRVTSGTTVKDAQLQSDVIANRVKGMLKGAFVLNETVEAMEETYYAEVQLGVCLTSDDPLCQNQPTLSRILFSDLPRAPADGKFTAPVAADASGPTVSGLIVDLSGTGSARVLDVRIKSPGGKEIYGPGSFDSSAGRDWLHWADSVAAARAMDHIVGDAPLVVKASRVDEGGAGVIVDDGTAAEIYAANQRNGDFLRKGSVILVVN